MEIILYGLIYAGLTLLWVYSVPMIKFREYFKLEWNDDNDNLFLQLINCSYCSSVWISFILNMIFTSFNLILSVKIMCITSLIVFIIENGINKDK